MPQTDGRTLREPRGEIYLQIIQQKWREGGGRVREWRADKSGKESKKEGDKERSKD